MAGTIPPTVHTNRYSAREVRVVAAVSRYIDGPGPRVETSLPPPTTDPTDLSKLRDRQFCRNLGQAVRVIIANDLAMRRTNSRVYSR